MTKENTTKQQLTHLSDVLDRFGADSSRWPDDVRSSLLQFVKDNADAKALLLEARAVDDVINAAQPLSNVDVTSLATKILAASEREEQVSRQLEINREYPRGVEHGAVRRVRSASRSGAVFDWQSVGLLAASLVVGVWIGGSGLLDTTYRELQSVFQTQSIAEGGMTTALAEDDLDILTDEDLL